METLVKRSDKVMFLELESTINRMEGFTALPLAKNPKEYTRQYVDQEFENTDVVGLAPSIDFTFDHIKGNAVHEALIAIIDGELLGTDAVVTLVQVDFTKEVTPETGEFHAVKRDFALIPGTEGDSMDAYTYSGTFKVKGEKEAITVTTTDAWKTCVEVVPAG